MKFLIFLCFTINLGFGAESHNNSADSLGKLQARAKHDSTRINLLYELGEMYLYVAPDTAMHYYDQVISLSENYLKTKLNPEEAKSIKKRIAASFNNKGVVYRLRGENAKAIDYYTKGMELSESISDLEGVASSMMNMGVIYRRIGDIDKALSLFQKSLNINEEIDNKQGTAAAYNNIGVFHYHQGNLKLAMECYENALEIQKEIDYTRGMAITLNSMGALYNRKGQISEALELFEKSLMLFKEIGDDRGTANQLNNIGSIYDKIGDSQKALSYFENSLNFSESLDDKQGMASTYNNIGNIYRTQGNIKKTLEYFTKSLLIKEEMGDKGGVALALNNIGNIYRNHGEINKALENYSKCFDICQEIGNKRGMATSLNSMGVAYNHKAEEFRNMGNPIKADSLQKLSLDNHKHSLSIRQEIDDKRGMVNSLNNIGTIYQQFSKQNKNKQISDSLNNIAFECFEKSQKISEQLNYKEGLAYTLANMGNLYLMQDNLTTAHRLGEKSYKISKDLGYPENIQRAARLLKEVYEKQGNYSKAYNYLNEEVAMRDSILNEENLRESMRQEARFEFIKKAAIDSVAHAKTIEIKELELKKAHEEKHKQQVITLSVVIGFFIVLVFLIILLHLFLQKREANKLLISQKQQIEVQNADLYHANEEISSQRDEILTQRDLVLKQKEYIEKQNQQITDSISYAQRIQEAILPDSSSYTLGSNGAGITQSFVLYKPKDIVSGDFYWTSIKGNQQIIALADCTGHGVPGAFMSMLGVSLLNELINRNNQLVANEILNQLRKSVKSTLRQKGKQFEARDGMSMALIIIDCDNLTMQYAGAYIPIYLYRNNQLVVYKADRNPIGIYYKEKDSFTNNIIELKPNDTFYLFTDGYTDQFGGRDYSKFKTSRLKNFLNQLHQKPLLKQKDILENTFETWKGVNEQIDDVTVLGFRI